MIYLYAHTSHKSGLDRARAMMAIYRALKEQPKAQELCFLVNDFRAGEALKEQMGLESYVTIESVEDIDMIASSEDSVVISTPESDRGKIAFYKSHFNHFIVLQDEMLIASASRCDSKGNKMLLFWGDSDENRQLMAHAKSLNDLGLGLLLGDYFYIDYQSKLSELFDLCYEPEEYEQALSEAEVVVSGSLQVAAEAALMGKQAAYLVVDKSKTPQTKSYQQLSIELLSIEQIEEFLSTRTGLDEVDNSGIKREIERILGEILS